MMKEPGMFEHVVSPSWLMPSWWPISCQDESSCAGLVRFGHHHNSSGSMRMAAPNDAVLPGGALIYREARGHSSETIIPQCFASSPQTLYAWEAPYETSVQVDHREQIRDVMEWKILQVFVSTSQTRPAGLTCLFPPYHCDSNRGSKSRERSRGL